MLQGHIGRIAHQLERGARLGARKRRIREDEITLGRKMPVLAASSGISARLDRQAQPERRISSFGSAR